MKIVEVGERYAFIEIDPNSAADIELVKGTNGVPWGTKAWVSPDRKGHFWTLMEPQDPRWRNWPYWQVSLHDARRLSEKEASSRVNPDWGPVLP